MVDETVDFCPTCGASWVCEHRPADPSPARRLPRTLLLLREQEACEHFWIAFMYKPKGEQCCKCRAERLPDGSIHTGLISADALYLADRLAREQAVGAALPEPPVDAAS